MEDADFQTNLLTLGEALDVLQAEEARIAADMDELQRRLLLLGNKRRIVADGLSALAVKLGYSPTPRKLWVFPELNNRD